MVPRSAHPRPRRAHGARPADVRIPRQREPQDPRVEREPADQDQAPISVASLLRREGRRVPHAADRALRPRGHHVGPAEPREVWANGATVRRAGGATCVLFAAASVFSAAVLTDATGGGTPNLSRTPDVVDGGVPPGVNLLGPAGPGADVGPVSLAALLSASDASGTRTVPMSSFRTPRENPGTSEAGTGGGAPVGSGTGPEPASGLVRSLVGGLTQPVEDLTRVAGAAVPDPVGVAVEDVGDPVDDTGDAAASSPDELLRPDAGTIDEVTPPAPQVTKRSTSLLDDDSDSGPDFGSRLDSDAERTLAVVIDDDDPGSSSRDAVPEGGRIASELLGGG